MPVESTTPRPGENRDERTSPDAALALLRMRGIVKRFPGVLANDQVDFEVLQGEIHALVGENGAGKSTLMNILYGLIHPDSGEILIDGQLVHITGPRDLNITLAPENHPDLDLLQALNQR